MSYYYYYYYYYCDYCHYQFAVSPRCHGQEARTRTALVVLLLLLLQLLLLLDFHCVFPMIPNVLLLLLLLLLRPLPLPVCSFPSMLAVRSITRIASIDIRDGR